MNIAIGRFFVSLSLLLPILTVGCVKPAPPPPPPPPPSPAVIARVTAAKKIFLSNAGADTKFAHDMTGGTDGSYNALYASLRNWGIFQIVDAPAQADLIFEIRSTEAIHTQRVMNTGINSVYAGHDDTTFSPPIFTLSILDPSTKEVLYQIVSPAGGFGIKKPKSTIAFDKSINTLTDKIKALVIVPPVTQKQ